MNTNKMIKVISMSNQFACSHHMYLRPLNFQVAETVRLKEQEDFPFQYPHATTT